MNAPTRSRTALLAALNVFIGLAIALLLLEALLRLFPVRTGLNVSPLDADHPVLHFIPDTDYTFSRGWNFRGANSGRINNYGFVNDRDYDPAATTPLIAVIGDSYVEALMIPYRSTFHGRLAEAVGPGGRVYSFGMSGAPLSQYLSWASWVGDTFRPDFLVVVIIGNDFDESLIRYKNAQGYYYFDDSSADMPLVRVDYRPNTLPLRRLALYRYLRDNLAVTGTVHNILSPPDTMQFVGNVAANVEPERVQRSMRAVDAFLQRLPSAAHLPRERIVFVLDGLRPSLYRVDDLRRAETSFFSVMRRYLMDQARLGGFGVIDMQPAFIERHQRTGDYFEFPDDGHWNETAHGMVTEALRANAAFNVLFSAPQRPARADGS